MTEAIYFSESALYISWSILSWRLMQFIIKTSPVTSKTIDGPIRKGGRKSMGMPDIIMVRLLIVIQVFIGAFIQTDLKRSDKFLRRDYE
jgi:hypothetical protein